MSASANKVFLVGYVGADPEARGDAAHPVAVFSMVTTYVGAFDAHTRERSQTTTWHNVVAFGALAARMLESVRRGHLLYVEGTLRYQHYTDRTGVARRWASVYAHRCERLGDAAHGDFHGETPDDEAF